MVLQKIWTKQAIEVLWAECVPKVHVEALTPSVMVSGGGGLWEEIKFR